MDSRQANKKLRLSSGSSKNYFNDPHRSSESKGRYSSNDDELDLWGDELAVDDDLIQRIETQGYSQYHGRDAPRADFQFTDHSQANIIDPIEPSRVNDTVTNLQLEIQTKSGEVKNLRIEMESKAKDFRTQLNEKDAIIEDLKKQLSGKQSEIEFQKIEKLSQISKTPKSATPKMVSNSKPVFKQPQNFNSSFHERFTFGTNKNMIKEPTVFSFSYPLRKGDVLYKLLQSAVSFRKENFNFPSGNRDCEPSNATQLSENEFTIYLETYLLQLCRYSSFDQVDARKLLNLVLTRSEELLLRFHKKLSQKEIKTEISNRKSRIITLPKTKDTSLYRNEEFLLMNTKLTDNEKGVPVRQTITMLAKIIQVEPNSAKMLVESDKIPILRCPCSNYEKAVDMSNLFNLSLRLSSPKPSKSNLLQKEQIMDIDAPVGESSKGKKKIIFDIVELVHDIIQEITVREKSSKYEGVFSSIMHLYSVLCNSTEIYEKQYELMIRSVKKILFSLPGFLVVQYIIEFLSSCAQFNFYGSLCCRSAAETFSENFKYFSFTKETCMLQVICAYIEMVNKTPKFIFNFVSWMCSLTSTSHVVKWLSNKTDSKFCECLLMLEQITIKIVLNCVNQYHNSKTISHKKQTKLLLRRSTSIFQQFRWRDPDFDLHISTCRGEYRVLLQYLRDIVDDDVTHKFVAQELEFTNVSQKYDLTAEMKTEVIENMLKVFSEDDL